MLITPRIGTILFSIVLASTYHLFCVNLQESIWKRRTATGQQAALSEVNRPALFNVHGLQIATLLVGQGITPKPGTTVTITYKAASPDKKTLVTKTETFTHDPNSIVPSTIELDDVTQIISAHVA